MITLAHGRTLHLVRRVTYHVPGRGYVVVEPGTQVKVVAIDQLTPTIRRAIEASAHRDEATRGVQMILVHVLGQPRLLDVDDVFLEGHAPPHGGQARYESSVAR